METQINNTKVEMKSIIKCPECSHQKAEEMPTDACQFFYECENCRALLKPNKGDCCVFCSFGTEKCPPIQKGTASCC
ncbi:MAG: hypothetical protein M3033_18165 [Acidobacteriota bacterium]|nr:hypothetical protein [Acidobacteriota bacterium]